MGCHSLLRGSPWPRDWTLVSHIANTLYHLSHQESPRGGAPSNFQTVSFPPYWGFPLSYSDPKAGSAGLTPRPYTQCGQGTAYNMHFSDVKPESRVIKWPIKVTQPAVPESEFLTTSSEKTSQHHGPCVASSKASGLQSVLPQSRQQHMQSDSPLALTTHSFLHPSSSTTKQLFAFF